MRIYKGQENTTTHANIAGAQTKIIEVTIPAGTVWRMEDGTALALKLYRSTVGSEVEISPNTTIYLGWKDPVSPTIYFAGEVLNYGTFQGISWEEQQNVNTKEIRQIRFDTEELERAERGEVGLINGLLPDYKLLIMINSPDVVNWDLTQSRFQFDMIVQTAEEAEEALEAQAGEGEIEEVIDEGFDKRPDKRLDEGIEEVL